MLSLFLAMSIGVSGHTAAPMRGPIETHPSLRYTGRTFTVTCIVSGPEFKASRDEFLKVEVENQMVGILQAAGFTIKPNYLNPRLPALFLMVNYQELNGTFAAMVTNECFGEFQHAPNVVQRTAFLMGPQAHLDMADSFESLRNTILKEASRSAESFLSIYLRDHK